MDAKQKKPVRERKPKRPRPKAIVDVDGCTGCEVCVEFCPVDCILTLPGEMFSVMHRVCVVDEDRCTGCTICARECPWETIAMVYPEETNPPQDKDSRDRFPTARRQEALASTSKTLEALSYNG